MLNWDELNEVENTDKNKQVPQEVVTKAVKQTTQEKEEASASISKLPDLVILMGP